MSENVSWMIMLSYCMRMALISLGGQILGIIVCSALLKRRRSLRPLMCWLIGKFMFAVCFLEVFMAAKMAGNPVFELVDLLLNACAAIITAFMFYYTFHGSALKCVTAMNISEILAGVFMLPAVLIVNTIQGKRELFLFQAEFQLTDLLIPVVEFALFAIFYHFAAPFLKQFRTYQIRHKKLFWAIYVVFVSSVQLVSIGGLSDNRSFMFTIYVVFLTSAVAGTLAIFFIYIKYRSGIRLESAYLGTQLGLLETHYRSIQSQMQQMENSQKMIAAQMEEITNRSQSGEGIQRYLENLKQEYNGLRAGMYCDNWSVDAVLYCQIEAARQKGIEVDCRIQDYDSREIAPKIFSQILFLMLHYGISELQKQEDIPDKNMHLKTGKLQNQMIIEFFSAIGQKRSFPEKKIKQCIREYGGSVTVMQENAGISVIVTMKPKDLK